MVGPAKAYRSVGAGSRASYSGDTHSARSRHSLSYVSSGCGVNPDWIFTHNKLLQARSLTSPDAWVLVLRILLSHPIAISCRIKKREVASGAVLSVGPWVG